MSTARDPIRYLPWVALGLAALAAPWWLAQPARQNLLLLALMAAQLGVAWNILGGYAGQVSLGHAAFFGIGAYVSTMLRLQFDLSPWWGALAGGATAVGVGTLIGWPCFRLKGHYFTMATIAVAEIVQTLFNNWEPAGAAVGLTIPMDKTGLAMLVFDGKGPYLVAAFGLLAFSLAVCVAVEKSHLGYYLRAIKDEPDAARSLGVNLTRYKLVALGLSSSCARWAARCMRRRSSTSTRPRCWGQGCRSRSRWRPSSAGWAPCGARWSVPWP